MPIIQLPGGNNPLVGAGAAASAFDDRTRDLRRQKFQEEAQRRALEQRMAERQLLGQQRQQELGMQLAAGSQREYMRREEQERRFQHAEKEQDRLDDRERMRWMREQGLNPDATGANFIDLAARYEALDPQTYDAEFLPWLRDATGIDFGEGEGQVMPTPPIIGSIDPEILREGYSYLGSKIVPAQEAADERAVQRAYETGLNAIEEAHPDWFQSTEGQEWAAEYESAIASKGTDPSRARRIQRDFTRAASTQVANRDARRRWSAKIDEMLVATDWLGQGPHGLHADQLAKVRDMQAEIAGARTQEDAHEAYLKAYSTINPDAKQVEARAFARGRAQAEAEFQMRSQSVGVSAPSRGDLGKPVSTTPAGKVNVDALPGVGKAIGFEKDSRRAEAERIAGEMGLEPNNPEVAKEVLRRERVRKSVARDDDPPRELLPLQTLRPPAPTETEQMMMRAGIEFR